MPSSDIVKANGAELHAAPDSGAIMKLVTNGDCSSLTPSQLTQYYNYRCQSIGLDPACTPFQLIKLNGKLVMYALKACTDQLTALHKLTVEVLEQRTETGIRVVRAKVTAPDGRSGEDIGCVTVQGLAGDALCNAMMKAVTKAKRRAVLSFCGLGMLDESELETIPDTGVQTQRKAKTLAERLSSGPGQIPPGDASHSSAGSGGASVARTPAPRPGTRLLSHQTRAAQQSVGAVDVGANAAPEPPDQSALDAEAEAFLDSIAQPVQNAPQSRQDAPGSSAVISAAQRTRLFTIARKAGWTESELREMLEARGYKSTKDIPASEYEAIMLVVEGGK